MTLNLIAGVLGFLFITISKMKSLQTDAEKANLKFIYSEYFKKDLLSIILSFLSIFVWQILFSEISTKYPQLNTFVKCSYFVMGAFGTWFLQTLLSKTKGWIRKVVDEKTNIADNKI